MVLQLLQFRVFKLIDKAVEEDVSNQRLALISFVKEKGFAKQGWSRTLTKSVQATLQKMNMVHVMQFCIAPNNSWKAKYSLARPLPQCLLVFELTCVPACRTGLSQPRSSLMKASTFEGKELA
eukprot:scaffold24371_cov18-Tisochrysis_lutea.AAC.3